LALETANSLLEPRIAHKTYEKWIIIEAMSPNVEAMPLTTQTLFLTVNTVEKSWKLGQRSPAVSGRVIRMLEQAKQEWFIPLLTQTEPADFDRSFDEFAAKYAHVRIEMLSLLLGVLGPGEFKTRYVITLAKALAQFPQAGAQAGLDFQALEEMQKRYLKVSVEAASSGQRLQLLEPSTLDPVLHAIVASDFGMTALALIFDGSIPAPLWRIRKTFDCTNQALLSYEHSVKALIDPEKPRPPLRGSLNIEGDLDSLFAEMNKGKRKRKAH
jgi:hypothetical protein